MRTTISVRKKDFRDFITEEDNIKLKGNSDSIRRQSSLSVWEKRLNAQGEPSLTPPYPTEKAPVTRVKKDLGEEDIEEIFFDEETTWYVSVSIDVPEKPEDHKW